MRRPGVRWVGPRWLGVGACALLLAGCSAIGDVLDGGDSVLDTGIEPVSLSYEGPAVMGTDSGPGLVVRDGSSSYRVRRGYADAWLPDGNALVSVRRRTVLVDPSSGETGDSIGYWDPSRVVSQLNVLAGYDEVRLRTFGTDLSPGPTYRLPETDDPAADEYDDVVRNYYGAVPTIAGTTFVKWHDGSETYEDGAYGVLKIDADGDFEQVLPDSNVVGLYLSADGTGLIGLRQVSGKPCGGCVVDQEIVEIDPETGEIAAEYGVPEPYSDDWRVAGIDKVGDRVAVRYYDPVQNLSANLGFTYEQRGTWVYEDGDWTMLPGSEDELTWWQGTGRVVARVSDTETERGDGFDLFWIPASGEEEPIDLELSQWPQGVPTVGLVAGQYLDPSED